MLTMIWSTPRTGSTWYSGYLYNQALQENNKGLLLKQFLNEWRMNSYGKQSASNLIYQYEPGASYAEYFLDPLGKIIKMIPMFQERKRNVEQEEEYRIWLLENHNYYKSPIIIHHHVNPMSKKAYNYLKNKASRNIYLYRENIIDQLASYVVATFQQKFMLTQNAFPEISIDAEIPMSHLEHFYTRIQYWHTLDKSNCEIVKFEDLDFSLSDNTKKQNDVKPIEQVSESMRLKILELHDNFRFFRKNKIS